MAQTLEEYLAWAGFRQEELRATKPTDSTSRRRLKHLVPAQGRGIARKLATDAVRIQQAKKAARLTGPRLLHLGSGGEHKDGWTNIDLLGDPVEIAWNLTRPLPFPSGSAEGVFHEHLLEHLPLRHGATFMRECFRVLKPGGVLRVGVPNAGRLLLSYAGDRCYLEEIHPGRPTAMLALQELFYWHRHRTMFDTETLALAFTSAGLKEPVECIFGGTKLPLVPDTERRRAETLYMEAVR